MGVGQCGIKLLLDLRENAKDEPNGVPECMIRDESISSYDAITWSEGQKFDGHCLLLSQSNTSQSTHPETKKLVGRVGVSHAHPYHPATQGSRFPRTNSAHIT